MSISTQESVPSQVLERGEFAPFVFDPAAIRKLEEAGLIDWGYIRYLELQATAAIKEGNIALQKRSHEIFFPELERANLEAQRQIKNPDMSYIEFMNRTMMPLSTKTPLTLRGSNGHHAPLTISPPRENDPTKITQKHIYPDLGRPPQLELTQENPRKKGWLREKVEGILLGPWQKRQESRHLHQEGERIVRALEYHIPAFKQANTHMSENILEHVKFKDAVDELRSLVTLGTPQEVLAFINGHGINNLVTIVKKRDMADNTLLFGVLEKVRAVKNTPVEDKNFRPPSMKTATQGLSKK